MKGLLYLKRRNTIFIKTLISYVLIFTIPLVIFGIASYYWAVTVIKEQTANTYVSALDDIRGNIDRSFNSLDQFAVQLSYIPWVAKLMSMEGNDFSYEHVDIKDVLDGMQELHIFNTTYELVDDIAIYFNGKDTILSTKGKDTFERFFQDLVVYPNISLPEWKQMLSRYNSRTMLHPDVVRTLGQPRKTISYIQSLPPGDKSFAATLILWINEQTLRDVLQKSSIVKYGSLYVTDADNRLVTSINPIPEIQSLVTGNNYTSVTNGASSGTTISEQEEYAIFYTASDKNGWKYTVAIPTGTMISKINYIRSLTIALSLFYLVIGFVLSYTLAMKNYRPLANIIDMVRTKLFKEETAQNEFMFLENAIYSMLTNENRSENEIRLYKPLARNTLLTKILNNEADDDGNLPRLMELLDISFPDEYFMCAVILLREDHFSETFHTGIGKQLKPYGISVYLVEADARTKIVVLNMENTDLRNEAADTLAIFLNESSLLYRAIGIGNLYNTIDDLHKSYMEASIAIDYRFVKGEGSAIFVDEMDDSNDWVGFFAEEEQMINYIKGGDIDRALALSKEVIYDYIHKYRLSPHVIRYLGYSVAAAAMKSLEDMNISSRTSISLKEILAIDHVEEMVTCIEHIYREACRLISLEKESHNVHLIDSIHEYINRYYANPDLSLTNAAEAFCISSSYLSRFFKNQTGYNFIDCLNKRRIEASQRLFTGDITVLEVAKQVGFDNDITFRRLFKKYTGMTPSQFYKGK